jgi:hypothetical protein
VTGLVRDISLARNLADTVALGLLLSPEQHARGRLATAGLAAAIRQQAHVISYANCCAIQPDPAAAPRTAAAAFWRPTCGTRSVS